MVIGEILAGYCFRAFFFGHYFHAYSSLLFPDSSLDNLKFLSQIGLIFFMYVVGMELDLKVLKKQGSRSGCY